MIVWTIATVVTIVTWGVRLELRTRSAHRRLDHHEDLRNADLENAREHRQRVERTLENIQNDVKTLLTKSGLDQ